MLFYTLLILGTVYLFGFGYWWAAFTKLAHGRPLLDMEERPDAPWGLIDLFAFFVLWILSEVVGFAAISAFPSADKSGVQQQAIDTIDNQSEERADQQKIAAAIDLDDVAAGAGSESSVDSKIPGKKKFKETSGLSQLTLPQQISFFVGSSVCKILATIFVAWTVYIRGQRNMVNVGIVFSQFWQDCKIAFVTFCMLAPVMFTVQAALVVALELETTHPIIVMISESRSLSLYWACFFSATIAAPLGEEYFFRHMLQGWLEKMSTGKYSFDAGLLGAWDPSTVAAEGAEVEVDEHGKEVLPPPASPPARLWPILVSATCFAAVHLGHGAAPVSLFILSLGIGYVYQRTHRVVPCILIHVLLNSMSMLMLWEEAF